MVSPIITRTLQQAIEAAIGNVDRRWPVRLGVNDDVVELAVPQDLAPHRIVTINLGDSGIRAEQIAERLHELGHDVRTIRGLPASARASGAGDVVHIKIGES